MHPVTRLCQEPYRLLFPLGTVCAAIGLGLWVGFWLDPRIGYPGTAHALIMMHGFVGCFIVGFLLTMLPRALGVAPASPAHLIVATAAVVIGVAAALAGAAVIAWSAHLALLAVPASFALTRVPRCASSPPPTFACVALAGVAAIGGTMAVLASSWGAPAWVGLLGRSLDLQAFPLLMIIGIGSFLAPKLAGPSGARVNVGGARTNAALGAMVLISYVIEHAPCAHDADLRMRVAYALRAGVLIAVVLTRILPARLHVEAPPYLRAIPISLVAIAAGLTLPVLWPAQALAWLHLVYVAGMMWLCLTIGSRVLVGHAPALQPPRSWAVAGTGALLAVAALTRVVTGCWPGEHYVMHLAIAALLALAGLGLWSAIMTRRVWSFPSR